MTVIQGTPQQWANAFTEVFGGNKKKFLTALYTDFASNVQKHSIDVIKMSKKVSDAFIEMQISLLKNNKIKHRETTSKYIKIRSLEMHHIHEVYEGIVNQSNVLKLHCSDELYSKVEEYTDWFLIIDSGFEDYIINLSTIEVTDDTISVQKNVNESWNSYEKTHKDIIKNGSRFSRDIISIMRKEINSK